MIFEPGSWADRKYEVLSRIGSGSFGDVFKARDRFLKRVVAIKLLRSYEPDLRARFLREVELQGSVVHKNITTVFDFGLTEDGRPFSVMEFLDGQTLGQVISGGVPIAIGRRTDMLWQVCSALSCLHAHAILHRDLKPANVFLLEAGTIKVMDLGLGKSLAQRSLTHTGEFLGTFAYTAPEVLRGEEHTYRSDIFACGVLAYELLTYQRPFDGVHVPAVIAEITSPYPPRSPRSFDSEIPKDLQAWVLRALEKDPARRPQTASELLETLPRGATERQPIPSTPEQRSSPRTDQPTLALPERARVPKPGR